MNAHGVPFGILREAFLYALHTQLQDTIPRGDSECFHSLPYACDQTEDIFLYFFTELITYHLSSVFFGDAAFSYRMNIFEVTKLHNDVIKNDSFKGLALNYLNFCIVS